MSKNILLDVLQSLTDLNSSLNSDFGAEDNHSFEFDTMSYIGFVVLALIMFMATLGGVGGTSAILPTTLIFFGLEVH